MDNLELLNNLIKAESTKEVVKVLKNFNLLSCFEKFITS